MVSRLTHSLLFAAVLAGSAAVAEPSETTVPAFGPGEQATYRVKYLGMTAGTATVTVGDAAQDAQAIWPIVTQAKSDSFLGIFPVKDRVISYWDAAEHRTLSTELIADEGHKRRRQRIELDHGKGTARVVKQKEGEPSTESQVTIEPGTQDVAAVTFALRGKSLDVGKAYSVPVFTGTKTFTLRAAVESRQRLKTSIGEREVFKLRVQTAFSGKFQSKRDMFAYLTTDSSHVPVRIEADFLLGTIVAELTDYKQGRVLAALTPDG